MTSTGGFPPGTTQRMVDEAAPQDDERDESEYDELDAAYRRAEAAERKLEKLVRAAKAVLLFHSGAPWDSGACAEWKRLTGKEEATTKVMCDTLRAVLARIDSEGGSDG